MRKLFTTLLLLSLGISFAQEKKPQQYGIKGEDVPKGLAVAQEAPDIKIENRYGEDFHLSEALEEGPVVLTFYRGTWCPYCTRFMAELYAFAGDIDEKGAEIVAVSPEAENTATEEHQSENLTLLHDRDGEIMKKYDVDYKVTEEYQERLGKNQNLDIAARNEQEIAVLPVAATYVINQDGEIVYRHFDLDYKNRAPIDDILKALDEI